MLTYLAFPSNMKSSEVQLAVCRQNGVLEIMGGGLSTPGMQDMIVATLIGMLEWRKHNNKVWIILLAAIPF